MSRHRKTEVHLEVEPSVHRPPPRPVERTPQSVLLVADFSGAGNTGAPPPGSVVSRLVDRDTVDEVMAAVAPRVALAERGELVFRSLDDLHPDQLLQRVRHLGAILDGRDAPGPSSPSPVDPEPGASKPATSSGADLLGRILDRVAGPESEGPEPSADGPVDSVRAFAAEAARRDVVPPRDPGRTAREADARSRAGDALRAFLRRPDVRATERRWRSVDFLARRLDTGPDLHLHLADLSLGALAAEISAPAGVEASAFRALLTAGAGPEGDPWTYVVLLDAHIGPSDDDQVLLAWATALCASVGATLLTEGHPALAGIPSLGDLDDPRVWEGEAPAWAAFRTQPEADAVGVALPGFLLRYPYGADGDPIDTMAFEEISGAPGPDDLVWASGAVAAVAVLVREGTRERREGAPDTILADLPLHAWRDGVADGTVCGPVPMTDGAARRMLDAGLIPVAWSRGRDAVRLLGTRAAGGGSLL